MKILCRRRFETMPRLAEKLDIYISTHDVLFSLSGQACGQNDTSADFSRKLHKTKKSPWRRISEKNTQKQKKKGDSKESPFYLSDKT